MATEPFLINPPKRLKRKIKVRGRHRRRNPIGETLVTIGANPMRRNPWFGDSEGHRIAALMRWGKISGGKVSRHRRRVRHKAVKSVRRVKRTAVHRRRVRRSIDRRTKVYAEMMKKQRREAAAYMGLSKFKPGVGWVLRRKRNSNPYGGSMSKRRRRVKRNTWFGQPRRHRKAAKKGWRRGHMLSAGKRRRRVRHGNPMTAANPKRHRSKRRSFHSRRRHRSNPAIMAQFSRFTGGITDIRSWGPLAITGGLSAVTGAVVPGMLGVTNPWAKYGVQTAVAVGGGMVVENFVDKRHGQAWMIVGVAMVGYQLLKEFVLQPYFPQFAVGLGDYQEYYPNSNAAEGDDVSQQIGAFPQSVGAFPSSMNDYPGVGGDGVGAYPYDGSPY